MARPKRTGIPTDPASKARFDEAVKAFRRKLPLPDPLFRMLTEAQRQTAFWVAGVTQAVMVQDVFDALASALKQGTPFAEFKKAMGDQLFDAWGKPDSYRLETVFRNNTQNAYNAGRVHVMDREPVRRARRFWRFDSNGDNRTTDICRARDGIVLPADHPFWQSNTPQLHHGCRSTLVPLTERGAGRVTSDGRLSGLPPVQEGFGKAPPAPYEPREFDPQLDRFDPKLAAKVKQRLDL